MKEKAAAKKKEEKELLLLHHHQTTKSHRRRKYPRKTKCEMVNLKRSIQIEALLLLLFLVLTEPNTPKRLLV